MVWRRSGIHGGRGERGGERGCYYRVVAGVGDVEAAQTSALVDSRAL